MKKVWMIGFMCALLLVGFFSCSRNGSRSTTQSDSLLMARGQEAFAKNCASCHSVKLEGIGPPLGALPRYLGVDWIKKFVKNPQGVIEAGDERAQRLIVKYNVVMPSFGHLPDSVLNGIITYLKGQPPPDSLGAEGNLMGSANPITDPIPPADLKIGLKLIAQFPYSSDEDPRTRITKLDVQPATDNLFVLDLRGTLYRLRGNQPEVYLDLAKVRPAFIQQPGLGTGFGSFAFHPQFAKNGLLYTTHTEGPGSAKADFAFSDSIKVTLQWVVTEWKTDRPSANTFSGQPRELLRINMATQMHGIQEIAFNPNARPGELDFGLLYVCIGDGGQVESGYPYLVHSPDKPWGSVFRIDPSGKNSKNGQYGIPSSNPFFSDNNQLTIKEIFASGFRNPHRITWDRAGQILVSNIGHNHIESLNLIVPGANYGWPIREGTFSLDPYKSMSKIYPLPADDSTQHFTYPVVEFDHDEGKAISGGYEYRGNAIPALNGKFIFGDIPTGRLFYVEMKDLKNGTQAPIRKWVATLNGTEKTLVELCGPGRVDLHFGQDRQGELYLMTKADGKLYKIVDAVKLTGTN